MNRNPVGTPATVAKYASFCSRVRPTGQACGDSPTRRTISASAMLVLTARPTGSASGWDLPVQVAEAAGLVLDARNAACGSVVIRSCPAMRPSSSRGGVAVESNAV
jgi:hypothetical protein